MIEHTEKKHDIELLVKCSDVIDGHLCKLDFDAYDISSKARLPQIVGIDIHSQHTCRAARLHLERIEAGIAAYVENRTAAEIGRDRIGEAAPLDCRIVAEKMVWRGHDAAPQINIVKPKAERGGRLAHC